MKRNENESYEDYVKRRKEENAKTKLRLKGINIFPGDWGTFRKDIDGKVESRMQKVMEKFKDRFKNKDE
jgi:hypothetical protein|nr:hypothetical protein [uncultured Mediterranean phage uvMED]